VAIESLLAENLSTGVMGCLISDGSLLQIVGIFYLTAVIFLRM